MRRRLLLFRYILSEILPTFFLGFLLFVSILLIFQVLRLTETMLVHQVGVQNLLHILFYLAISFIPLLIPMSLVFSLLITYHKLSSQSEIIAMRALGYSFWPIATPAILLGVLLSAASLATTFRVGPWGNHQFKVLMKEIVNSKLVSSIKSGTFSEGFFDIVIYTDSIDQETKTMDGVFLYDERDPNKPTTIVAKKGQVLVEKTLNSYKAFVRLQDGEIHNPVDKGHALIHFEKYDLNIVSPIKKNIRRKSKSSLSDRDLQRLIEKTKNKKKLRSYLYEFYNRIFIALSCIAFSFLGLGLGLRVKARSGRGGGGPLSVLLIVLYWIGYLFGNSYGPSLSLSPIIATGIPFFVLAPVGLLHRL